MNFADEIIRSKQNRTIIETGKLSDKKTRDENKLFKFDGLKLFLEAIEKGIEIIRVFVREDRVDFFKSVFDEHSDKLLNVTVQTVASDVFGKLTDEQSPEGIVCVAGFCERHFKGEDCLDRLIGEDERVFMLESLRDPGNLGTVIRSAKAFGIDTLVLSGDCVDIYNQKVLRGAMGALFGIKIVVIRDLCDGIKALKAQGRRVYASALDKNAKRLDGVKLERCDVVIVGNEGHGLSESVINEATSSLYIPMEEGSESLNAGVAASVIMWSAYKN